MNRPVVVPLLLALACGQTSAPPEPEGARVLLVGKKVVGNAVLFEPRFLDQLLVQRAHGVQMGGLDEILGNQFEHGLGGG